jgi:hypothetical protein
MSPLTSTRRQRTTILAERSANRKLLRKLDNNSCRINTGLAKFLLCVTTRTGAPWARCWLARSNLEGLFVSAQLEARFWTYGRIFKLSSWDRSDK